VLSTLDDIKYVHANGVHIWSKKPKCHARGGSLTSELIAFIGHHGTTCLPCSGEAESGYNELLAERCSCRCQGTTQPTEGPVDSE